MNPREPTPITWSAVKASFARPYPVTGPMVLLVSLIPLYLFVPELAIGSPTRPELPLDRFFPLWPIWSVVYGAVYLFLILLPVLVVREQTHIRSTVRAYLLIWLVSFAFFVFYPTAAPRPPEVVGESFGAWALRFLYSSDPPFNCFPSLHVAHSFVSALAVTRVHRRLGLLALVCAALVALSTLYTRQHYIADAIAGIALAGLAYRLFLHGSPRELIPELDRRLAPRLAWVNAALVATGLGVFVAIYWLGRVA